MNGHWSDRESIDILRISINNYPKFLHLKNIGQPDKFYDDRCFSKFHNLGRNGKSIKSKIDNIQKKFRKNIRSMDINKFRDGIIDDDYYKNDEMKELFNTSFEFERLFGKFCGSKELMKIIEMVCHSDYWTKNRHRIHPRWSKRFISSADELQKSAKPTVTPSAIVISSAESSPRNSDDLNTFKDSDFVVRRRQRYDSTPTLTINVSKKRINQDKNEESSPCKIRSLVSRPATDIDDTYYSQILPTINGEAMLSMSNIPIIETPTVVTICDSPHLNEENVVTINDPTVLAVVDSASLLKIDDSKNMRKESLTINGLSPCIETKSIVENGVSCSSISGSSDKETVTTNFTQHLSVSEATVTDIEPSQDYESVTGDGYLCKKLFESMMPIVNEVANLSASMRSVAESLQQLVQIMSNKSL